MAVMTPDANMTAEEKLKYRVKLFRDAYAFQVPERTAHYSSAVTWKIIDAGYKFSEAFMNFDIMQDAVIKYLDKYPCDCLLDNGARNTFNVMEAFGEQGYYYYDDDACVVGVHPFELCPSEDLVEYAKNPMKYNWEHGLPQKWSNWENKSLEDFQKAFDAQQEFNAYVARITNIMTGQYGIPNAGSPKVGFATFPIETMFNSIRGIRGLSLDLRRNKEKLKEAIDIMDQASIYQTVKKIQGLEEGGDETTCFDATHIMLAHTVLGPKQYEMFYRDSLDAFIKALASKKKTLRITVEGSVKHLFSYFQDYEKGVLGMLLEQDDIYESRAALPNICMIGGMDTNMLGFGTVEECLDRTKKLIDELTPGFIFAENKFISYRNDANAENFKAISDFVASYMNK